MTTFPGSPRTVRGGIVVIDPESATVRRVIALQYNPDTLTRSLQVQGIGADSGDRVDALRLKGAPVETIKFDAEIDATDHLEFPGHNRVAVELGIHPQLAALEMLVYPSSATVQSNLSLARMGTLEIVPLEMPLALFVWSKNRILPVRVTEFSITEESFDVKLNPIRAKVSLGLRVLTVNDLGFDHKGASLFMAYHQQKEKLAEMSGQGDLGELGIRRIP